jgi:glycosyltransferase involved in cell wall biosynthesis
VRVLLCSQAAHTGGGVEVWMETLTAALQSRGVEVVTALAKGRFHDPARYTARHRVANPIAVDGISGYREVRTANLLDVFDRVHPDVIIPVNLADALFAAAYGKTRGAQWRIAVCIHGQGDDRIDQVRSVAPFVDLAVSVAKRVAMRLEAIVPNVRHIPTGVPPPAVAPRVRDSIAKIGYIGRLDQAEKRALDLIAFSRELPEVEIHVAGSGAEERRLRQALPRATFHGAMSREALYEKIYPLLDAIVIFSEAEAGPIVAWEAMVNGAIPIVSDYVGRAEENVIRDGETGIVFPVGDMVTAARKVRAGVAALSPRELPEAYTLAAFERSWLEALTACVASAPRRGDASTLPPLVSPGRLASLGLSVKAMARLRRLTRGAYLHDNPGSEWPH